MKINQLISNLQEVLDSNRILAKSCKFNYELLKESIEKDPESRQTHEILRRLDIDSKTLEKHYDKAKTIIAELNTLTNFGELKIKIYIPD